MQIVRYCLLCCLLLSSSVLQAQWAKRANVPLSGGVDAGSIFSIGDKVYYGGGFAYTKGFWEYDPLTDKWISKADIPVAKLYRCFGVSFSIGSKGYVAFGQSDTSDGGQATVTADLWEYDPSTNGWTQKSDFPGAPRDGAMAFVINGKAYIGAGVDAAYGYLGDFYSYDPVKDEWTPLNDLPSGPIGFPMTFAIGATGYMVGGGVYPNESTKGWSYNPLNDKWSPIAEFPGTAREAGVGFSIDTLGYVGLGESAYSKSFADLYSYDPRANTWAKVTPNYPYSTGVGWPVATVVGNTAYLGTGAGVTTSLLFSNLWYSFSPAANASVTEAPTQRSLAVYPNPTQSKLFVSSPGNIIVYDMLGREMTSSENASSIDISNLLSGSYHYTLTTSDGVTTGNFVKR